MSLLDHAMNVAGLCQGKPFTAAAIKPGFTVTRIDWGGCMATDRNVVDIGDVVRHQRSPHSGGAYQGVIVRWDKRGEHWEALDNFRMRDGELEVWI